MPYPSVGRKAYVHSIFTEMRAANLLTQDEWHRTLGAWAGGEGNGVTVGSIHELGAAIWREALKHKNHPDVRFHKQASLVPRQGSPQALAVGGIGPMASRKSLLIILPPACR